MADKGKPKKKIAVLVRERTEEAMRMALGLTLLDDRIDVYLTGEAPAGAGLNKMNLEMLRAMKAGLFSFHDMDGFTPVSEETMPEVLLDYDIVIAY